jgi:hypothetical protein
MDVQRKLILLFTTKGKRNRVGDTSRMNPDEPCLTGRGNLLIRNEIFQYIPAGAGGP